MRILPVTLRFWHEPADRLLRLACRASAITHRHPRSQIACRLYCLAIAGLLRGQSPSAAHLTAVEIVAPVLAAQPWNEERRHFAAVLDPHLPRRPEKEIASGGHVVDTLTAGLWCLLTSKDYVETVLKGVNLGGDTDTTGIVAGGLAGACYGLAAFPSDGAMQWREHRIWRAYLQSSLTSVAWHETLRF